MKTNITETQEIQDLLDNIAGMNKDRGDDRTKAIVRRITADLFASIEDLDINESEFWNALHFMQAGAPEYGLIAPGLGFDRFLDLVMDERDRQVGKLGGTPRTIEGPLYVENAPLTDREATLSEGVDGEPMLLTGVIKDLDGKPIENAIVDIWHASSTGGYSHFDPSLADFALRRRIRTGADGSYTANSIVPAGYAVPPQGSTQALMDSLGRHGQRPAHIHFFVSAPGFKHLTTQINLDGDPMLNDDFAFATRDELVAPVVKKDGVAHVAFDLELMATTDSADEMRADRPRTSV